MAGAVADWLYDRRREGISRRSLALLFVIIVHLLLGYMLFVLSPQAQQKLREFATIEARNVPDPAPKPVKVPSPTAPKHVPKPVKQPPSKPPPPPPLTFGVQLTDPLDISKLPNHRSELAQAEPSDSNAPIGPGQGPGGQPLYNAEWVREPTHAELAPYFPNGTPPGSWAAIACKTVEGNRVEDCVEIDESPHGSRLASSYRDAAWQFRVRPPRRGGKPLWGAWVYILYKNPDDVK